MGRRHTARSNCGPTPALKRMANALHRQCVSCGLATWLTGVSIWRAGRVSKLHDRCVRRPERQFIVCGSRTCASKRFCRNLDTIFIHNVSRLISLDHFNGNLVSFQYSSHITHFDDILNCRILEPAQCDFRGMGSI